MNTKEFYSLLTKQADFAVSAASQFATMMTSFDQAVAIASKIDTIEHEADQARHALADLTDRSFMTPMDKDDITDLADALDDITDCIESVAGRIVLYKVKSLRPDVEPMVNNLLLMTQQLSSVVNSLGSKADRTKLNASFINIHRIENDTDDMFRTALGNLFETMRSDPVEIMIWKEIYDRVERAVDKCETAANVVESMVVKYA